MATYEAVKYSFVGSAITAIQSPNIADGSVTNTEFQHLDGTTSDIQTQLDAKFGATGGTFTGNVTLNDNVHLYIGTGGATDLDLYHDSSNSYIKNSTGNLNLNSDSIVARDDGNTLNMFNASSTGAFNAYHNNSLRFSTTSGGASVAGILTATTFSGSGASLTNLNASALASGTVPDARFPATLPALNGSALTNLNATNVSGSGANLTTLTAAYPVGSIYMNATSSANPSSLLGFGTWAAFGAGRVPVGIDSGDSDFDTAEETGGAKTHTLAEANLPAHNHTFSGWSMGQGIRHEDGTDHIPQRGDQGSASGTFTSSNVGSGDAVNHMNPYIVVYMWKRTA
tara:strand:+ start:1657 stop:2679 length:1023 start_codon:yes stop_codon:yes gene_type:complete